MKRRSFLKTACLASSCLLPACKSTMVHVESKRVGKQIFIEKTLFNHRSNVTLAYNKYAIGVVKFDNDHFAASLLACTHNGCALTPTELGFICPCHGARFDALGQVKKGPTEQNLTRFITSTNSQSVIIHLTD